jgi:putative addiction module component (TIGR02574 family)
MSNSLEQLEQDALALSPEEREMLAERLLRSTDGAELTEIDSAWAREADRRYEDYLTGKVQGIPGDQIFSQIRRELGWSS